MSTYKIGEFAKKIGVSVSTLRRWDKEGLLIANRSPLGTRFYTDEHYQNYMKGTKNGKAFD